MKPSRIGYVVNTFPKISETFVIGELAEVARRGVDLRVLSLKVPDEPFCHHAAVTERLLDRTSYEVADFETMLDQFQPELLHAHFATEPTAIARVLATRRGIPFTFTAHGYDVYRKPPADLAERAAAAAAVVTVSHANRSHLTERCLVAPEHVQVIPCGVDTNWFTPGAPDLEPPLIVCVARLRDVKRLDVLLEACALVRDAGRRFRCAIVGEGIERASLEGLRRALDLDADVEMPGAAEQSEIRSWWQRAAIAVLSSRSEGMPVSLMEAAACGVPAVAPGVGGIPELIAHGETGIVTEPGDPASLAAGLIDLIDDEPRRAAMGQAARRRAEKAFSRETQIDQLLALWTQVLS
jgi:colanic acid/amylovoran biosynthesis glycosyltransferase